MKKLISIILALVMVLGLCACGNDGKGGKGDKGNENGKVTVNVLTEVEMTEKSSDGKTNTMKGVVEYDENYNLVGTKTYLDGKLYYEVTYDKSYDKPLTQKSYDEDGNITDTDVYTYDANGNCVERISTYEYDGEEVTTKTVYTYDANGNVLTDKYYRDGELESETRYTYTASGAVESESYTWNGQEENRTVYTYDEQDNVLTETQYIGQEVTSIKTYENTYEGGKLKEVNVYQDGELDERTVYDADENEILNANYMDGEVFYRSETTYENGNMVKYVSYYGDEMNYCQEYTYNADGKVTERVMTDSDGETQRRVYSYNDKGEQTAVKVYEGDELQSEYSLTYQSVTVSEEVAKNIKLINAMMATF